MIGGLASPVNARIYRAVREAWAAWGGGGGCAWVLNMLLAGAVLCGQWGVARGQLMYQLYGYYPNPATMYVQLDVRCDKTPYVWKQEDGYPTCHSQLDYIKGRSGYYPYSMSYVGVDSQYPIPNPLNWDKWQTAGVGPGDRVTSGLFCDQGLGNTEIGDGLSVCKHALVCTFKESYWSQRLSNEYDPKNPQTPQDSGRYYQINKDWEKTPHTHYAHTVDKCTLCAPVECLDFSCANGALAMAPVQAYSKKVFNRPNCVEKKCVAGTFLTCSTGLECRYQVPSTYHMQGAPGARAWLKLNQYEVKSDLNMGGDWPLPVTSCYPCKFGNGRTHFGNFIGTEESLFQDNFLQFECPGGALGPRACGKNKVSRFDNATGISGVCQCKNGWYQASPGDAECTICPAGYRCRWDGLSPPTKVECEVDTYSDRGQTECRKCIVNTNICPKSQALTRCVRGNSGAYQSRDAFCTDCGNCRQVTNADGALPCNRVISVVSADGSAIL
jgi:hypothetical protein